MSMLLARLLSHLGGGAMLESASRAASCSLMAVLANKPAAPQLWPPGLWKQQQQQQRALSGGSRSNGSRDTAAAAAAAAAGVAVQTPHAAAGPSDVAHAAGPEAGPATVQQEAETATEGENEEGKRKKKPVVYYSTTPIMMDANSMAPLK